MKKALKPNTIYISDNGRMICEKCAGQSALYTGRDISGQKVDECSEAENEYWVKHFGSSLKCESGCTEYGHAA